MNAEHGEEVTEAEQRRTGAARDELEQINIEEKLLEFEQTAFPQVQAMFQSKEPYDKLWRTAYSFTQKHEKWLHGM